MKVWVSWEKYSKFGHGELASLLHCTLLALKMTQWGISNYWVSESNMGLCREDYGVLCDKNGKQNRANVAVKSCVAYVFKSARSSGHGVSITSTSSPSHLIQFHDTMIVFVLSMSSTRALAVYFFFSLLWRDRGLSFFGPTINLFSLDPPQVDDNPKAQDILSPDGGRQKTELTINKKKNIAMTDCLVFLYSAWRQSVIAILCLY